MASPFPFTSGQVLTAAQLNSIGEATAFTPSWTNFTPGDATESWFYIQVNEFVHVFGASVLGSTSAVTGGVQMTVPVGNQTSGFFTTGTMMVRDATGGAQLIGSVAALSTTAMYFYILSTSGSYAQNTNLSATVPISFTTGDSIGAHFSYRTT